jgi:hypothetical protein
LTSSHLLALACGSRSIRSTLLPCSTKAPERQTAVVVFPTPPLWFTTATVFTKSSLSANRTVLTNGTMRKYQICLQ